MSASSTPTRRSQRSSHRTDQRRRWRRSRTPSSPRRWPVGDPLAGNVDQVRIDSYLAANKLQVACALSITIASAILGTCLVRRVLLHTAVLIHSNEVEGRVETTVDSRQVHIEGEFVVHEGEHLVLAGSVHEIEAGADVGAVLVLGNELYGTLYQYLLFSDC